MIVSCARLEDIAQFDASATRWSSSICTGWQRNRLLHNMITNMQEFTGHPAVFDIGIVS
jgi:hypothetical protein